MVILQNLRNLRTKLRKNYFGLAGLGSLEEEFEPYKKYLKGVVFNAGAGHRPIEVEPPYLKTDFDADAPVDFLCDLHYIPLIDRCVDSILTVAVLEHTRYPWLVLQEFARILKPGGILVLCAPFLQPEHAIPHDYYRYTVYGVQALVTSVGLNVIQQIRLSRYHRAIGWILQERWRNSKGLAFYMQSFLVNQISRKSQDKELPPFSVYTGSYTVAEKEGISEFSQDVDCTNEMWYQNLLADPITKKPLIRTSDKVYQNEMGDTYHQINGKFDFRPKGKLSQDFQVRWGEEISNNGHQNK